MTVKATPLQKLPKPPSPTRRSIDAITDALTAHTGHDFRLLTYEESNGELLCVWDAKTGRQYALSIKRLDFTTYQATLGVRRGIDPIETRLDVRLDRIGLRALLDDPEHIVGLWLGQRSGFFRGPTSS